MTKVFVGQLHWHVCRNDIMGALAAHGAAVGVMDLYVGRKGRFCEGAKATAFITFAGSESAARALLLDGAVCPSISPTRLVVSLMNPKRKRSDIPPMKPPPPPPPRSLESVLSSVTYSKASPTANRLRGQSGSHGSGAAWVATVSDIISSKNYSTPYET
jgi:hypothetical protein